MLVLVSVTSNSLIGVFHSAIVGNVVLNNLKQEFHHKKKYIFVCVGFLRPEPYCCGLLIFV